MLIDKYKPRTLDSIIAQPLVIKKVLNWLENWKRGKALMLYGPTGIGKGIIIELIAKEKNLNLIEINASDSRDASSIKKLIPATKNGSLLRGRLILIDEADNMSREDRGGSSEIIDIIKTSSYPIILIAQDAYDKKLRTVRNYCELVKLRKVPKNLIERRLTEIAKKEKLKIGFAEIKKIAEESDGDIRSAINDLETESLGIREREKNIFDTMQAVFKGDIKSALKAIDSCDKNLDEVFWWAEQNITNEYSNIEDIALAFEFLSKADLFRSMIYKNQNYRFKKYMRDMIASMSTLKSKKGFTMYRPPDMLIILGRTKTKRKEAEEYHEELGKHLHCSKRKVKEQMPYLNIILKK
ncbi:MAG: replication factor C large subunit [Candidatus Aenigmatarchaeota archaeon]